MEEIGSTGRIEIDPDKQHSTWVYGIKRQMQENIDLETVNRIRVRENSRKMKRGHKPERLDCGWS